jgi:hypothetical protein
MQPAQSVRLTFAGPEVRCESGWNVGFGAAKDALLVGKAN